MNFTSMDYFVALSEERSFTRAAERLSVTQQTLSAHVANVERELGVRLVNRRVPLTLTYAGEVFLGYARRLQSLERSMRQEFFDIAGDQQVMDGIVPAARHDAVRAPIMTKKRRTPPMVRTPSRAMPATARGLCPRARP